MLDQIKCKHCNSFFKKGDTLECSCGFIFVDFSFFEENNMYTISLINKKDDKLSLIAHIIGDNIISLSSIKTVLNPWNQQTKCYTKLDDDSQIYNILGIKTFEDLCGMFEQLEVLEMLE